MILLTIKELSQLIKVKQSTLYAWASRGIIPSFKLNGLLRFDEEEIEKWIEKSKVIPLPSKKIKSKNIKDEDIDLIVKRAIESVKGKDYNFFKRGSQTNQARKGG